MTYRLAFACILLTACGSSSITSPTDGGPGKDGPIQDGPIGVKDGPLADALVLPPGCLAAGATCGAGDTCCFGTCTGGRCPVQNPTGGGCTSNGNGCNAANECCSSICTGGTCAAIPGAVCLTEGNSCGGNDACCSKTCIGGRCVTAGGSLGCHALGDICFQGMDCCSGVCNGASGTTPGTCAPLATFGSGGCMMGGEPCVDGTNCCSRVCAPIPGAGNICQIASGCRITGDTCRESSDCCGGPGTMTIGAGEVTCNKEPGATIGTCSKASGEQTEGNICGLDVNARNECLGCMSPKIQCCKPDDLGVPRCYGGSTSKCPGGYNGQEGCCIAAGGICAFSGECCGGAPCLPDGTGVLRCSSQSCVPAEGTCTATGDCCTGLECVLAPGAPSGTCKMPIVNVPDAPPGTPDASPNAPDAGLCALGGQSCGDTTPCCDGYVCDVLSGTSRCPPGGTDCTCYRYVP